MERVFQEYVLEEKAAGKRCYCQAIFYQKWKNYVIKYQLYVKVKLLKQGTLTEMRHLTEQS